MSKTIEVIDDGQVFRPVTPPDLEPNTRGQVAIEEETPKSRNRDTWDTLDRLAGSIEAPEDWSSKSDYCMYGPGKD